MPTPPATDPVYDDQFYDEIGAWADTSARVVVPLVERLVHPTSVVDVGCGTGAWLAVWHEAGVTDILGIDGDHVSTELLQIDRAHFRGIDLEMVSTAADPPPADRTFDLAVSLEVAEHLQPASARGFVRHLTSLAPVVLFSAAVPGQGGVGHVNEQWPAYWAAHFAACGYQVADVIRPVVWDNPDVAFFYAQNLLLYACDDRLAGLVPAFPTTPVDGMAQPLPLVHPGLLEAWQTLHRRPNAPASLSTLFRQLPRAGFGAVRRRVRSRTDGRRPDLGVDPTPQAPGPE